MEGSEESSKNLCECYKKLGLLGIPLYINEESGDFGEDRPQINYETAFRFPELLRIDENIGEYPVVGDNDLSNVFEDMSRIIIGLADYDVNVLSFWILDMFIEGLWTSQKAGMEHDHQKATLLWIAYFFNYIIRQNPTRKEMFRHLKDVLFCPEGGDGMTALDSDKEDSSSLEGTEMWSRIETKKQIWNLPLPPPLDEPGKDEEGFFSKISSS
ncbi:hypothetical protein RUM44_002303 [Polyplax serrata]|uniref:Uncharacterized protein n=1 Tax=Polyplax serrata TaxID=468196 RepID=A0ABR1AMK2_POLSC